VKTKCFLPRTTVGEIRDRTTKRIVHCNERSKLPERAVLPSQRRDSVVRWLLCVFLCVVVFSLGLGHRAEAGFLSQFSLSLGEEYNDNIFFDTRGTSDFITYIAPSLSLSYVPSGEKAPVFTAGISAPLQIFAKNNDLSNFADNAAINGSFQYQYSPRLSFEIRDEFRRVGETRTSTTDFGISSQASLVNRGQLASNEFLVDGNFLYSQNLSFTAGVFLTSLHFLDEGGTDITNRIRVRSTYKVGQNHNLFAGYTLEHFNSRGDQDNVVHNFDFGSDYFSNYEIQLTPTLTFSASGGISTGSRGVRPRISAIFTKLWPTASVTAGLRSSVTSSLGLSGLSQSTDDSGLSQTTVFFSDASISFTEYLTGIAATNFSHFDTLDSGAESFNVFEAQVGVQYLITYWLSSNLAYTYRWRDSESTGEGVVNSNSITLFFTSHFDIWPSIGLSKSYSGSVSPSSPLQSQSYRSF